MAHWYLQSTDFLDDTVGPAPKDYDDDLDEAKAPGDEQQGEKG